MERPLSTMSEASNYTGAPDNATNAESPAGRVRSALRKQHTTQNIRLQYSAFAALQVFKEDSQLWEEIQLHQKESQCPSNQEKLALQTGE